MRSGLRGCRAARRRRAKAVQRRSPVCILGAAPLPTAAVVYGPAPVAGALLATSRGAPLWPYWDAATRRQIEHTAAELGVRLVHCAHPVRAIERRRGAEIVAGVGAIAERPARLYAHLTGRCHEQFATFEALRGSPRPSVVFVPWGLADADLLAWASSVLGSPAEAEPLVGLFVGFDEASLYLQARSEEHTSELQSLRHLVCRLLLETK